MYFFTKIKVQFVISYRECMDFFSFAVFYYTYFNGIISLQLVV